MRTRHRGGRVGTGVAAVAVMLLLGAGVPHAAGGEVVVVDGRIELPAAGDRLCSGTPATVRWSQLPTEVEELEVLLSLDGGRSFKVRLTPSLDPATRELSWVVPNLPAHDARLRLRVGVRGVELESATSAPFAIVGNRSEPLAEVTYVAGEWWTTPPKLPPEAELPARELRLAAGERVHVEDTPAMVPETTEPFMAATIASPLVHTVGPLDRPMPAAWSQPTRPVAPPPRI